MYNLQSRAPTVTHRQQSLEETEHDEVVPQLALHADLRFRFPPDLLLPVPPGHVEQQEEGGARQGRGKQDPADSGHSYHRKVSTVIIGRCPQLS